MKIEITLDQEAAVVVKSIKYYIKCILAPNSDPHESVENKTRTVAAMLRTLEFYLTPTDYKTFVRKNDL
jgi:hypothetical protein